MCMTFVKRLTDIISLHVLDVCVQINGYQDVRDVCDYI